MGAETELGRLPLHGVQILDFTRLLPGPYCTLLLADLGADIIKIEPPLTGDPLRTLPDTSAGANVYFKAVNRNKRSMTLNLRAEGARTVLHALASRADVVVESFRPETARGIGVDAMSLLAVNPRLVHCAITGFGQTGPYAEQPGHDINYVALSGLLALDHPRRPSSADEMRDRVHTPQPSRAFIADIGGGAMSAAIGILAGLLRCARTGEGSSIDASMHDGSLAWLTFPAARTLASGDETASSAAPFNAHAACYNVYQTRDGRWVALYEQVAAIVLTRPCAEWLALFEDADACLSPVNSVAEALADPHAIARGSVTEIEGARYVRSPVRLSAGVPLQALALPDVFAAPRLGEHTDEVLMQAGFSAADRARLTRDGIL